MTGKADGRQRRLAGDADVIYISGLVSTMASVYASCRQLLGRRLVAFIDNGAAFAAPTKGKTKNDLASEDSC